VSVTSATGADVRAGYQDPRGVFHMASPVRINDPRRRSALEITAPGGFGPGFPKAGDVFTVVLRYWNFCNPYDDPNIPGPPADLINGDHRPIEKTSVIRIVAPPAAPVTTTDVVCNGVTPKAFSVSGAPVANTIKWYENIPNPDRPGKLLSTGRTLAMTAHPEWVSNAVPGVYKVWASQQPTTGTVTCESPKTMVTRTIREKLSIEPLQPVPTELCNGTTLTVAMPPLAATAVGGPVKYTWQGADGIIVTPGSAFSADFATDVKNFNDQLAVDRTITIAQAYTTNPACAASKQYNLRVYQKPVGGQLSQAKDVCQGTAIDTLKLTAYTGTVMRWEVKRNVGAFTIFNGVTGADFVVPRLLEPGEYVFRAVVGNGNCAEVYSTGSSLKVFAMPAAVNAGADQFRCSARVSGPLGAGVPAIGTGRWSYVSSLPAGLPAPAFSNVEDANATISIADEYAGAYTLRWTVTNGSCQQADDVIVDFGTTPSDAVAGPDQALCASETALQGNTPEKGIGQWSVVTASDCGQCNVIIDNALSPTSHVALADANSYGTYTLRWSIRSGGKNCYVKTDDVIIRFDRPIDITAQDTDIVCIDPQKLLPVALSGSVTGSFGNAWWANVNGNGSVSVSTVSAGTVAASYTPTLADYTAGTSIRVKLVAVPQAASVCQAVEKLIIIQTDRKPVANAGVDMPFICADTVMLHADAPAYSATGTWSTGDASISFADKTDPFTTVAQLPRPPVSVFVTWTVTSASGRCVSDPSTIKLSRVAPPNVSDVSITVCEETNGATELDLLSVESSVTTLSAGERYIAWYRGQAGQDLIAVNPAVTLTDVTNGERFEAHVTDTRTGCMAQAVLTVLVPPAPRATDGLIGLCDETAGQRKVFGINLSDQKFREAITTENNASIKWYLAEQDAQMNNNATVARIDVTQKRDVYARVTGSVAPFCFRVVKLAIVVNSAPVISSILGRESVCQGHAQTPASELPFETYQVTPIPGAKYYWEVQQGSNGFKVFGGGKENDFYVLLQFPNTSTGTIRVRPELNGCSGVAVEKQIQVNAAPITPEIQGNAQVYENAKSVPFTVAPNNFPTSTYNWEIRRQSDNTPGGAYIVEGQATGNILLNVLTENVVLSVRENNAMCVSATASMIITVNEPPKPVDVVASFRVTPTAACFPATVKAQNTSTGADTYSWILLDGTGTVSASNLINPEFKISAPGTYHLRLTATRSTTGESASMESQDIKILDVPYAAFNTSSEVVYTPDTELKLLNFSSRAEIYQWNFGDGETSAFIEPTHSYQVAGVYQITLLAGIDHGQQDVDGDGVMDRPLVCYDTAKVQVTARDGGYIRIPNAFSPDENGPTGGHANSAGVNDVFLPIMQGVQSYRMQIFDRWGTKIFQTEDPETGWDGYNKSGELMPAGVYVYKIEVTLSPFSWANHNPLYLGGYEK